MNSQSICFGTGLVALDVILNGNPLTPAKLSAGGSCGNVLSILSFMGWDSFPVARLKNDEASRELITDLQRWNVHLDFLSFNSSGVTPIIIHRIKKDKVGKPVHRFEFRDPDTKQWLPRFRPITKNGAAEVAATPTMPDVFYFDRTNPGTYDLIKVYKEKGTLIYYEPSSVSDLKEFEKFASISDVVKFSGDRIKEFKKNFPNPLAAVEIETAGAEGLCYRFYKQPNEWHRLPAFPLPFLKDAAGSGDWCSAAIINTLFRNTQNVKDVSSQSLRQALELGQFLAAWNCLYDGARALMYYFTSDEFWEIIHHSKNNYAEILLTDRILKSVPQINVSRNLRVSELY